jgi:protein tyrosine phosphatase (PTP) superfamily phosphohydrolase (DUF442 family)
MTRAIWLMLFVAVLLVSAGCRSMCERRPLCGRTDPPPAKPIFVPPPPPAPLLQTAPIQQSGGFPVLPPGAVVNPPPGANGFPVLPPGAVVNPPPGANIFQPGPAPSISKAPPERGDTQWQPGDGREPAPRSDTPRDAPPRIQLYAPEPIDKDVPRPTDEPPLNKPSLKRSFPAIPQFAEAKENVYAGLRPSLDGLDWLQTNGVQTVVQIRAFGADDSAVRKEVESRSMRYIAFEVSPRKLTKQKVDEFIQLVRDGAKQGIFVYDQDGSLAGSMWYLYLRLGEILPDDAAQLRARQLGLSTPPQSRTDNHRDMWLAVQKLLSENSR